MSAVGISPGHDLLGRHVKRAFVSEDIERLRREAALLAVATHPGVVEVVHSGPAEEVQGPEGPSQGWELHVRRVGGGTLASQGPWSSEELAGYGAAAATTLADLHDLGIVHGALTTEHLLLDDAGRPVLCGFGQATKPLAVEERAERMATDVADLASCLRARLPTGADRRLIRMLDRSAAGHRHPPSARQLARDLGTQIPGSRLPGAASDTADPRHRQQSLSPEGRGRRRRGGGGGRGGGGRLLRRAIGAVGPLAGKHRAVTAAVIGVGSAAVIFVLAAATFLGGHTGAPHRLPPRSSPSAARSPLACPLVDAGCRPVPRPGDVLVAGRHRYRVGGPGDIVVLGRWTCRARALPVLLRPSSGQIWLFDNWATVATPARARYLTRVADATTLLVVAGPGRCDRLQVDRIHGPPIDLLGAAR